MSNFISRRDFLKGAAAVGFGAALGAGMTAFADEPDTSVPVEEPVEILDYDIVVCGTGTAGMAAACRAGQLGAKCLVLEALDEVAIGGASNSTEGAGIWFDDDEEGTIGKTIPGVEIHYEKGMLPLSDTYFNVLDYHKNMCNAPLVKTFLERSLPMYYWARDEIGIVFADPPRFNSPTYEGNGERSGGHCMIMTQYAFAKDHGIDFRFNTAGKELIMEDGRVVGILARHNNGNLIKINCKAVVMCGGGYLSNRELFEKYTNQHYDAFMMYGACGKEMGEAYTMGETVGAAFHHPECVMYCGPIMPGYFNKSKITICCTNDGSNVWVNNEGRRFIDESHAADWSQSAAAGGQWKNIYSIIDSDMLNYYETVGPLTGRSVYVVKDQPCEGLTDQVMGALAKDNPIVWKADTIEDLAAQINVNPERLAATIEKYNADVEAGADTELFKPAKYLFKVAKPPFYAFETRIGAYTCSGGLKVNENFQVLSYDTFDPIPGFYAAGGDAGGLQGPQYDRTVAGGSAQTWAREGGYYSIEHIVKEYIPSQI